MNSSPSRLVLIDQSLKDQSGHHFDYANCLGRQAQQMGESVVVGTHREFDSAGVDGFAVKNCFSNTTYFRDSSLFGLREMTRASKLESGFMQRWFPRLQAKRRAKRRKIFVSQFREELESFLLPLNLSPGDHILFVTLNELELTAISELLERQPNFKKANWHFQFHFDPYDVQRSSSEASKEMEDAFHQAVPRLSDTTTRFYSTNSILANEYNQIGAFEFEELAYPVNQKIGSANDMNRSDDLTSDQKIQVTIAGGVRREKGTRSFLPNLLEQVRESKSLCEQIQFTVQGKRNSFLSRLGDEYGSLLKTVSHPLPETEYASLIRKSSIGLLNYDRHQYRHRRAGILGEFLSAGVPVIVPSSCWLASQIEPFEQEHAQRIIETKSQDSISLPNSKSDFRLPSSWSDDFGKHSMLGVRFVQSCDREANSAIQFILGQNESEFRKSYSMAPTGKPIACLCPWPPQIERGWIRFSKPVSNIELFWVKSEVAIPRSAVGVIVESDRELVGSIEEISTHLEHYCRTAIRQSVDWKRRHHPSQTLNQILNFRETRSQVA